MAGVYVHIPFCKSFCIYCDFFSVTNREKTSAYIDSLLKEIELRRDFFGSTTPSTLYFGGGTPSLLSPEQLSTIASSIISTFFAGQTPSEFTMEVNPDDITPEYASALCAVGANRISMGVQSFDDAHLKWMRRRHSASGAKSAFRCLREAGFRNISLDLIFGYLVPGEDEGAAMNSWMRDLQTITELHPEHISAYQMSIEPGSALEQMGPKYTEPAQEFCAEQYSCLQRELLKAGYIQYEISNFALPGYHSRHNSSYWEREPYIGLGAAAHSFRERTRSWNPSSIEGYLISLTSCTASLRLRERKAPFTAYAKRFSFREGYVTLPQQTVATEGPFPVADTIREAFRVSGKESFPFVSAEGNGLRNNEGNGLRSKEYYETLTEEEILEETLMLGLRRAEGIEYRALKNLPDLLRRGLLIVEDGRIRIPPDKFFISDYIISELL